ncbi:aldo/keto reductase [Sphingobium sp. HWE2-09]|uniref:aldo/keto reductase n=1 Tax=Sphingobium sp. HWE2-09 TaxID=3108390 RepID=UPI002DC75F8C|nr:aldo/keto reductase [Sphingobium sp. HWE2-09]
MRSIGVSNFNPWHLQRIINETGVVPVINQIKCQTTFHQRDLRGFHRRLGIATEAWSPLGRSDLLARQELTASARRHGRSVAQIILRWQIQQGPIVILRTSKVERLKDNADIFDFAVDDGDMAAIAALDSADGRSARTRRP